MRFKLRRVQRGQLTVRSPAKFPNTPRDHYLEPGIPFYFSSKPADMGRNRRRKAKAQDEESDDAPAPAEMSPGTRKEYDKMQIMTVRRALCTPCSRC